MKTIYYISSVFSKELTSWWMERRSDVLNKEIKGQNVVSFKMKTAWEAERSRNNIEKKIEIWRVGMKRIHAEGSEKIQGNERN